MCHRHVKVDAALSAMAMYITIPTIHVVNAMWLQAILYFVLILKLLALCNMQS